MKEWIMKTTMDNFGYFIRMEKRNKDKTIKKMEHFHIIYYSDALLVYWAFRLFVRPDYIAITKPETGTILKEHYSKKGKTL